MQCHFVSHAPSAIQDIREYMYLSALCLLVEEIQRLKATQQPHDQCYCPQRHVLGKEKNQNQRVFTELRARSTKARAHRCVISDEGFHPVGDVWLIVQMIPH